MIFISACSDSPLNSQKQQKKQQISKIDGKPIIKIDAANLYKTNRFTKYIQTLAAKDGSAIMRALKEKSASLKKNQSASVAVKDLDNYAGKRLAGSKNGSGTSTPQLADIGTELHVKDADGEVEKFVMTLHPWNPNPIGESSRQVIKRMVGSANNNSGGNTYLALDPDFFYIHDNANGDENYPVTFPAVSLTDSTQKIMVTLTRKPNGKVVFHFSHPGSGSAQARSAANGTGGSQPNLVFAEATPIVEPNYILPNPGGGGSGGGGDDPHTPDCTEVEGRGGPTGGPPYDQTYFSINDIRLNETGDGDGAAELQMFVKQDNDYNGKCFSRKYKYRFDTVFRGTDKNTIVEGADGVLYKLPDVNHAGIDYVMDFSTSGTGNIGFPLFNLSAQPGPWRLVLSDDDKDYPSFSHRRRSNWAEDIHTFDMGTGTWNIVKTGFTTTRKKYGSSDDPIDESGLRNITITNLQNRNFNNGILTVSKNYSGIGTFKYQFSVDHH